MIIIQEHKSGPVEPIEQFTFKYPSTGHDVPLFDISIPPDHIPSCFLSAWYVKQYNKLRIILN